MKLSIVILNWNGSDMMKKYLPTVIKHSEKDAKVIVADNASSDDSIEMLKRDFPEVDIIALDKNYGFAEGYNQALKKIDSEYYLLLNSDVEVTENWLQPLLKYMDEHQDVAACQPKLLSIYDKEVSIKSGIIKAQTENLSSESSNNKYQVYLDKLDAFAQTFADISDKYIETGTDKYTYGEAASDASMGVINSIGLFSGSNIKTLKFNENLVNDLTQDKLDYLASIQWKDDLSFDGKGQNIASTEKTSLTEYFRDLKVNISSDKENTQFLNTTQKNVKMSIESSYNLSTKVDKDEEMLNLIKFQSAYTANAKIVTVIDEMLQTLLGLKR
mgnify:CR=1 FL=1